MKFTILLFSPNAKRFVSVVDGIPDFDMYAEPTRSILQAAYEAGDYEIVPDTEPIQELPAPNWDGLYQALMVSAVYAHLVGIGQQLSSVDGALDKTIDAIQYGIFKPDSMAALPAFQSAINLLLFVLTNNEVSLSVEQLLEVRNILDANSFQSITLGV